MGKDNCVVCGKYLREHNEQETLMCNSCDIKTDKIASDMEALNIHNVVKSVCEHTDTHYDDRSLGMVCKECRCVIPD